MNPKIKSYILAFFLAVLAVPLLAQPKGKGPNSEKVDAMRVAFISQKLNLSVEEAQVFWPVYNQYQAETKAIKKASRMARKEFRENKGSVSDQDFEKLVDGFIQSKQEEIDVVVKYHEEFKKVLPIRKVAKLYRAEEEFKMMLLKELQKRKQESGGGR